MEGNPRPPISSLITQFIERENAPPAPASEGPGPLYRLANLHGQPFRLLPGTIYALALCGPDDVHPDRPIGLWQCQTVGCGVNGITIERKQGQADVSAPALRCPECSAPLVFLHHVCVKVFTPVKLGEPEGE
jgi:hypothetical protein